MIAIKVVLTAVLAYLLGSLSVSILLSRATLGGDVREKGSGNAGATNMARVYGWGAGVLTLCGDMLKALIAIWIGWRLLGDTGLAIAGIAAITGHCFPVFHGFKGGKGISVGAAIGLAIDWRVFLLIIAVFLILALLSRKVSVGSVGAALAAPIASLLFAVSTPRLVLAVIAMCIAIFQHRENIKRLLRGTEPDFKAGKSK